MMPRRFSALLAATVVAASSLVACDDDIGTDEADATEVYREGSVDALAVVSLLNDPATTVDVLKKGKVTSTTAKAILAYRDGADGTLRTSDDDLFDRLAEVDAIKGVGTSTIKRLRAIADERGYVAAQERKERQVIFSPQPLEESHNAEVAALIRKAQRSVDVAMYSFSDAGIQSALADAVKRGVKVRFLFDTASEDKKLTGAQLASSKSGKLEANGVDVRWVNKIMHHKLVIIDGPRTDLESAATATVVSGSANWSNGGATKYDENTLFLTAYPEMALRFQREFDLLWSNSRDLVANPNIVSDLTFLPITDADIVEDPGMHAFFTSANFGVKNATFSTKGENHVAEQLVRAIEDAEERIHIASGHLRSRPVSEALMKKRAESPEVEIMIVLDGQEYVSESGNTQQKKDRETCLAAATTPAKERACLDKSFLYGLEVSRTGIDVRYKTYSYRWDASYAVQMHNKFFVVDDTLFTGSYNLSDNAEHETFENVMFFGGPEFTDLVEAYEERFQLLFHQGEGLLPGLRQEIDTKSTIPLLFESMALTWEEVRDLRALIAAECPAVNSAPFRENPASHLTCTK